MLDTEIDHGPGCITAQVPDAPFGTAADLVPGSLQLPTPTGVLLTPALLFLASCPSCLFRLQGEKNKLFTRFMLTVSKNDVKNGIISV